MTQTEWNEQFDQLIVDFAENRVTWEEYNKKMSYLRRVAWRVQK